MGPRLVWVVNLVKGPYLTSLVFIRMAECYYLLNFFFFKEFFRKTQTSHMVWLECGAIRPARTPHDGVLVIALRGA